jgi:hypothetical protein
MLHNTSRRDIFAQPCNQTIHMQTACHLAKEPGKVAHSDATHVWNAARDGVAVSDVTFGEDHIARCRLTALVAVVAWGNPLDDALRVPGAPSPAFRVERLSNNPPDTGHNQANRRNAPRGQNWD